MKLKFNWMAHLLALVALMVTLSSTAGASIVVLDTPVNTAERFEANVTWTAGDAIEVIGVFGPTGTPWLVTLFSTSNLFLAVAQHQFGPHADDLNPNPSVMTLLFLGVPGGSGADNGEDPHPVIFGDPHRDYGVMTISSSDVPAGASEPSSTVNLVFTHASAVAPVPEPATLALGLAGLGLFAVGRRSFRVQ